MVVNRGREGREAIGKVGKEKGDRKEGVEGEGRLHLDIYPVAPEFLVKLITPLRSRIRIFRI